MSSEPPSDPRLDTCKSSARLADHLVLLLPEAHVRLLLTPNCRKDRFYERPRYYPEL